MDTAIVSPIPSFSISPQQLAPRLSIVDAPLLLDVRPQARYAASDRIIAGAQRCAPEDIAAFAAAQQLQDPRREIVVYCVYGHQVSAGAAAMLRAAGLNARLLAGGFAGGESGVDSAADIANWRTHALPTVPKTMPSNASMEQRT
ncbi:MAG: hypothetical protein JWP47_2401 [Polaromonas sp.]|nr:hypothetical protein [Polaromonas sp.]